MLALFNSINSAVCGVLGINSYLQGVIVMVCINVIAVLGMSVLTGFTRLFSFGNAGFMSIGAYTAAILAVKFNVNFLLAIVIGALFAGFIAFLLGSITLRLKGTISSSPAWALASAFGCCSITRRTSPEAPRASLAFPRIPTLCSAYSALCWRFLWHGASSIPNMAGT